MKFFLAIWSSLPLHNSTSVISKSSACVKIDWFSEFCHLFPWPIHTWLKMLSLRFYGLNFFAFLGKFPNVPFLSWLYCRSFKHQQLLFSFCLNFTEIKITKWGLEIWLVIKSASWFSIGLGFILTPTRDDSLPPVCSFRRSYSLLCLLQAPTHMGPTPTHVWFTPIHMHI